MFDYRFEKDRELIWKAGTRLVRSGYKLDYTNAKQGAFATVKQDYFRGYQWVYVEWVRKVNDLSGTQMDGAYTQDYFDLPKSVKDKFGNELFIGDKFKRDHGVWKDKDVFTVKDFSNWGAVWAKEDGLNSASNSVYKVTEDTGRYIVVVEQAGKLAPASTPKEYISLKQAELVAQEMAKKHKQKFFVFKAISVAEPSVKVVETVDTKVVTL